jgi:hypothetical protein
MTWVETLRKIISGMNFIPSDQKQQLLSSLETLSTQRPLHWEKVIRDYFRLTLRICAHFPFLTEKLQMAQREFELNLLVDEAGKEIFREIHPGA